jgi:ElaB/YqjD/DUF883 family membrane-anchored ribosome-binding protein
MTTLKNAKSSITNNDATEAVNSDIESLKSDFQSLQTDVRSLFASLGKVAKNKSDEGVQKGADLADDATDKLRDTQAYVEKQVRSNPLAAIGIALGAGYLISTLRR